MCPRVGRAYPPPSLTMDIKPPRCDWPRRLFGTNGVRLLAAQNRRGAFAAGSTRRLARARQGSGWS